MDSMVLQSNLEDQPLKVVRIAWCSPMDLPQSPDLPPDFELLRVDDCISNQFDLLVLDIQTFENLKAAEESCSIYRLPIVLLVDTVEEESAVLAWLKPADEICRRDAIAQQIGLRLSRSIWKEQLNQEMQRLLDCDPLTGIPNRRRLDNYLATFFVSDKMGEHWHLILLDIDHFKRINDYYGHNMGDQILAEMGRILKQSAFGAGIVARYAGEEFAVFMPGSLNHGGEFAEFVRAEIESHNFPGIPTQEGRCPVTASFGVASTIGYSSPQELIAAADRCLYQAKEQGRNCIVTELEFDAIASAKGQDPMIAHFENKIRVMAERMTNWLLLKTLELIEQYRAEADHDGLTGAFTRRYLDRLLQREWQKHRQGDRQLTIILLDLDYFGDVNRTYGFPTGDLALKSAVEVLQQTVRAGDWVTRYGGEEFCIVMTDTALEAGCQVAERIRLALEAKTVRAYGGAYFQVTASMGVVELIPEDSDAIALLQRASDKVREAKMGGRNQIRF